MPRPSCSTKIGHPFADGEPVHDITFENVQAGLRTDFLFRLANQNGGHGHRHVRPVGARARLGDLRRRRPDEPLRGQHRRPEDPDPARHPLGDRRPPSRAVDDAEADVLQSVLDTEISPELVPAGQDGKMQSTEDRIGPYALHDFALFHILRYGLRPSKIAFLAERAWADADAGAWPPGFPAEDRYAYDLPTVDEVAAGVPAALLRVRAVQALGDPERAQGVAGGLALAARRLARAVGRQRRARGSPNWMPRSPISHRRR